MSDEIKARLEAIEKLMYSEFGKTIAYSPEYNKDKQWLIMQLRESLERETSDRLFYENQRGLRNREIEKLRAENEKLKSMGENLPGYLHQIIRDQNDKLRADLAIAVEALEFYAEEKYWHSPYCNENRIYDFAQEMLSKLRKGGEAG